MTGTSFKCELAAPFDCGDSECQNPIWTMCNFNVDESAGGLIPALDFTNNHSLSHSWFANNDDGVQSGMRIATNDNDLSWPVELGLAHLLINFTDSRSAPCPSNNSCVIEPIDSTQSGPWTDFYLRDPTENSVSASPPVKIRASLCYDAL